MAFAKPKAKITEAPRRVLSRIDTYKVGEIAELRRCKTTESHLISAWDTFEARASHIALIMGALFHLKITTLLLKAVHCPGGVLYADRSVTCYEDTHLPAAVLGWFLLVAYAILFPVLCFVILRWGLSDHFTATSLLHLKRQSSRLEDRRGVKSKLLEDRRLEVMGFLYCNLKRDFYWYHCLQVRPSLLAVLSSRRP
jgi:hypothetical protein